VALGAFLPVRWTAGTAVAAAASTTVETLQHALDLGRVSSIDDVLLNTLGAVLAAQTSRHWWRSRSGDDEVARAPVP
jgi:glycopeptide antibiotics resistance protein